MVKNAPPGIADALGAVVGPHHVGRLQVLVVDCVAGLDQRERRLAVKVLPLAAHCLMRFRQDIDRLPASVAAFLAVRDPSRRSLESALGLAIPTRIEDTRAVGHGGERLSPQSYASLLPTCREWLDRRVGAGEAGRPAVRLFGEREGLARALKETAPPHGDTPPLGQRQESRLKPGAALVSDR